MAATVSSAHVSWTGLLVSLVLAICRILLGAASNLERDTPASSSRGSDPWDSRLVSSTVFCAWQICGDVHFLCTKVSELTAKLVLAAMQTLCLFSLWGGQLGASLQSHLEEFRVQQPEDAGIVACAASCLQDSTLEHGRASVAVCLSLCVHMHSRTCTQVHAVCP